MTERDYVSLAASYQAGVLDGSILACKWVRLACARNRKDLDRQDTDGFAYHFDPAEARKICQMAEMLPHIKGAKAVRTGEFYDAEDGKRYAVWAAIQLEPWQCWVLTTLFGWLDVADRRRFRVGFVLVPRKNAKSTIGAIVSLFMLTSDGESGAECYSAATTRDQAKVVGEIVWEMARRSKAFCDYFGVRVGAKTTMTLSVPATGSKFAPLSADAHSLDGLNISFAVIDELHAHKTRAVYDVIDTATGARAQPLLFPITTAGVNLGGICHEKLDYLHRVLEGAIVDESLFGLNYTIDAEDDWRDETSWRKANPNYGVSVEPGDLARKARAAAVSSSETNNFLTKHLNVWVRAESTWMSVEKWNACGTLGLTIADFARFPCWLGVDLAEVRDFAALCALFRIDADHYALFPRLYLPAATIDLSPVAQLSGWVRDGHVIETEGNQADFQRIEDDLVRWCDTLNVVEIDFDRALAAQMQQNLKRRLEPRMGRDAVDKFVLTVPQDTPTMDGAMKMTERLVLAQGLQHNANPAFAWMVGNVVTKRAESNDEIRPSKAGGKDSPNKIDGPVAFFNALSQAMRGLAAPITELAEWL